MPTHAMTAAEPLSVVLVVVLTLSVWFDVTEQKIPNWLKVWGLSSALVMRGIVGAQALWAGMLGGGLGFALGILLFATGVMGAGDGKLLTAVGAVLGLDTFLLCLPLIGAFGGLLALGVTIQRGTLIPTLLRFHELVFYVVSFGRAGERRTLSTPGAVTIPYALAVAAGAAMAWLGWGLTL
jgi:prepilin peptidase CpaA